MKLAQQNFYPPETFTTVKFVDGYKPKNFQPLDITKVVGKSKHVRASYESNKVIYDVVLPLEDYLSGNTDYKYLINNTLTEPSPIHKAIIQKYFINRSIQIKP